MWIANDPSSWSVIEADAVTWCVAQYPDEGCGLVLRQGESVRFVGCENIAASSRRRHAYELDARELLLAADRGEELVAIVHSHSDGPAEFSSADRREALMPDGTPLHPGVAYVVIGIDAGHPQRVVTFEFEPSRGTFLPVWARDLA